MAVNSMPAAAARVNLPEITIPQVAAWVAFLERVQSLPEFWAAIDRWVPERDRIRAANPAQDRLISLAAHKAHERLQRIP